MNGSFQNVDSLPGIILPAHLWYVLGCPWKLVTSKVFYRGEIIQLLSTMDIPVQIIIK